MIVQSYERSDILASPEMFFAWFSVDRSRFIMRNRDDTSWNTVNGRLGYTLVERALQCQATVGFFSRKWTRCFILDVDLHRVADPWAMHAEHLICAREILTDAFAQPSLLVRTPRGFHMIYFLNEKRHATTLREWAATRIKSLDLRPCTIDIAPAHNRGLRISAIANCRTGSFEMPGESLMPVYCAPDLRRRAARSARKARTRSARRIDLQLITFRAGESNDAYLRAIAKLHREGMTEAEAIEILTEKFQADGYHGDLSLDAELERRVASSYRNLSLKRFTGQRNEVCAREESVPEWIWRVSLASPFKHAQKERFAQFLSMLYSWKGQLAKERSGDGDAHEQRSQFYPGHARRSKTGAIPLPSVLMRRAYQRYPRFTAYLTQLGLLEQMFAERRPFQNDPELMEAVPGLCRYFSLKHATNSSLAEPQSYYNTIIVPASPRLLREMKQRHRAPRQSNIRQRVLACLAGGCALEDDIVQASAGNISKKQLASLCSRDPNLRRTRVRTDSGEVRNVLHDRSTDLEAAGFVAYRTNTEIVERGLADALLAMRDELEWGEEPGLNRVRAKTRAILAPEMHSSSLQRQFNVLFSRAWKTARRPDGTNCHV